MAFTKAPMNDTHNTIRLEVAGTSFIVSNPSEAHVPTTLSYYNCFPMTEQQWRGDPRQTIHKRDGYTRTSAGTIVSGGICDSMVVNSYGMYFIIDNTFYRYLPAYGAGTLSTVTTRAFASTDSSGTLAVDSAGDVNICWLMGTEDVLVNFYQTGAGVTTTTTGRGLRGSRGLVFINGYLFAVNSTGTRIYNSGAGGLLTTWNSTDYIAAEVFSDEIMWIDKHKNHLVVFGEASIEFFYDAGIEVGSPLARQESYTVRKGIYYGANPGKKTCQLGDDLYFIGKSETEGLNLCRIRNFKVEEMQIPFLEWSMNYGVATPVDGVELFYVNNQPMIMVNVYGATVRTMMFNPANESWWEMGAGAPSASDISDSDYRIGRQVYMSGRYIHLERNASPYTTLYECTPSKNTTSVAASIWSPVVDMGINFTKHIARVDAVGDFGNNVLTLAYNNTPNYAETYTSCSYTRQPSGYGYKHPASWYNIGPWRRGSFKLTMEGTDHAVLEGIDLEYNAGVA